MVTLIFVTFAVAIVFLLPFLGETFRLNDLQVTLLIVILVIFFAILASAATTFAITLPTKKLGAFLTNLLQKRQTLEVPPFAIPAELQELYGIFQKIAKEKEEQVVGLERTANYNEVRYRFLTTISHRLRTPLTGLRWALDELARENPSAGGHLLEDATSSTKRIADIIEDLLQTAKVENEYTQKKNQAVDAIVLLQDIVEETKLLAQSKKIKITFEKRSGAIPTLEGDKAQLHLAIQNILANAINYSPTGETVRVTIGYEAAAVIIKIIDHGVGIPKEEQALLFERFTRGAQAIKMNTEGTGLGLYLARGIIANHGGSISVISAPGKGSTFTIRLPLGEQGELQTFISH